MFSLHGNFLWGDYVMAGERQIRECDSDLHLVTICGVCKSSLERQSLQQGNFKISFDHACIGRLETLSSP